MNIQCLQITTFNYKYRFTLYIPIATRSKVMHTIKIDGKLNLQNIMRMMLTSQLELKLILAYILLNLITDITMIATPDRKPITVAIPISTSVAMTSASEYSCHV